MDREYISREYLNLSHSLHTQLLYKLTRSSVAQRAELPFSHTLHAYFLSQFLCNFTGLRSNVVINSSRTLFDHGVFNAVLNSSLAAHSIDYWDQEVGRP